VLIQLLFGGTDADVATVTFQSRDSFVEFVVDTFNDASFSLLPSASPYRGTSSGEMTAAATAASQLVLTARSHDNNRSLSVYFAARGGDIDGDDSAGEQLIVERRLRAHTDRLNVSLAGPYR